MNVITGTSDSGKSAIMRAMLWALKNRPSGEAFKSWDATDKDIVDVAMEFDSDWFIKSRVNGKNKYETEAGFFEALRSDVPEPVQLIANMTDYNIQTQFDKYFMLQDSPGDRAKKLNELVGLDIIDRVFKKLNSKVVTTNQEIKRIQTTISTTQTEIDQLQNLSAIESIVNKLSNDISEYEESCQIKESLRESIQNLHEISDKIKNRSTLLHAEKPHHLLVNKIEGLELDKTVKNDLYETVCNHHNIKDQLAEDTEWLKVEVPYKNILKVQKSCDMLNADYTHLEGVVDAADSLNAALASARVELTSYINDYARKLEESGTCPTCFSIVDKEALIYIIEGLQES
jgi:exonuclease SbcC